MKFAFKIGALLAAVLFVWFVILTAAVSIAKSSTANPTPAQVSKAYFKNQQTPAKSAGVVLRKVVCSSTTAWHVFKCDITFTLTNGKSQCLSQYVHTDLVHKFKGKVFNEWYPVWACRTRGPKPPVYPGDVDPRPGA